jgi:hypothetical protein
MTDAATTPLFINLRAGGRLHNLRARWRSGDLLRRAGLSD